MGRDRPLEVQRDQVGELFVEAITELDYNPYNNTVTHIMKTTVDIDDDLLVAAKAAAARRRTTLKAMIEHALRREIQAFDRQTVATTKTCFEMNDRGLPQLTRRRGEKVTSEMVYKLMDEEGI